MSGLPFENLSEEKQNEYFADGVQDQVGGHHVETPAHGERRVIEDVGGQRHLLEAGRDPVGFDALPVE